MIALLAKRWFLLVLVAGGFLVVLFPSQAQPIVDLLPQQAAVATSLLLSAWSLESQRLWQAIRRPGPAVLGVAVNLGVLPPLGYAASHVLEIGDLRVGLLIATALPCTIAAAIIWTRMAGGDDATALLITMLTMVLSWLATTSWLTLFTGTYVELRAADIMQRLALLLIVPLVVGQLARWPRPLREFAVRRRSALSVVARLLILIIIFQALVRAADSIPKAPLGSPLTTLVWIAVVCVLLHLLAAGLGFAAGAALGFDRARCIAVAFAGSQKTLPVGLYVAITYFSQYPLATVPILFFHVLQLVVDTGLAEYWQRRKPAPVHGPDGSFPAAQQETAGSQP